MKVRPFALQDKSKPPHAARMSRAYLFGNLNLLTLTKGVGGYCPAVGGVAVVGDVSQSAACSSGGRADLALSDNSPYHSLNDCPRVVVGADVGAAPSATCNTGFRLFTPSPLERMNDSNRVGGGGAVGGGGGGGTCTGSAGSAL